MEMGKKQSAELQMILRFTQNLAIVTEKRTESVPSLLQNITTEILFDSEIKVALGKLINWRIIV